MIGLRKEFLGRRKDGTLFPVEIAVSEGRELDYPWFTGIARDITRQKQLELQLRQSQKLEAIGHLAAGITHEISTPIQYVGDNLGFLQDAFDRLMDICESCETLSGACLSGNSAADQLSATAAQMKHGELGFLRAEVPQTIRQTREGVNRLAAIVSAMREFSHPGTGEKVLADINRAIESCVTIASTEWKYVTEVKMALDPHLPLVECLLGELKQVFLILIVNAAHAICDVVKDHPEADRIISISTHRSMDEVEIRVSDTGTGIRDSIRAKLFAPFFTTKDVGRGTGQGLAIARAIVCDRHGGSITFDTEVGVGTTFIIRLPIAPVACSTG